MAYAPTKLALVGGDPRTSAPCMWAYKSEDAMTTVRVAGYFADGKFAGMKVGDIIYVIQVNSSNVVQAVTHSVVLSFSSGAADIANGTAMTITDSD